MGVLKATRRNKNAAEEYIEELRGEGKTNLNAALVEGLKIAHRKTPETIGTTPVLFVMTDGFPNVGVSDQSRIKNNVKKLNKEKIGIYTIGEI